MAVILGFLELVDVRAVFLMLLVSNQSVDVNGTAAWLDFPYFWVGKLEGCLYCDLVMPHPPLVRDIPFEWLLVRF